MADAKNSSSRGASVKLIVFCSTLMAILLLITTQVWAAPVIDSVASNATHLEVNVPTSVTVTAVITDPNYLQGSANLQRRGVNGTWTVLGTLQNIGGGQYRIARTFTEPAGGTMHLRVSAAFRGVLKRALSPELTLFVSQVVQPSVNAQTVNGPAGSGLTLTIPPNALTEPARISIAPIPASDFAAPLRGLPVIATLNVIVRPLEGGGDGQLLTKPLQLSLPAPPGTPDGRKFYVAQPLIADFINGNQGGLSQQLLAVDTATAISGRIITRATNLAGVFGGGPTVVLQEVGSGYAQGVVADANGPRSGVYVTAAFNNSDGSPFLQPDPLNPTQMTQLRAPFAFFTDATGQYKIPIDPSPNTPPAFTVIAIDAARCAQGSSSPFPVPQGDATQEVNVSLAGTVTPPPTRTGSQNGGFELGNTTCQQLELTDQPSGSPQTLNPIQENTHVQDLFGPGFGLGTDIQPTEGDWMMPLFISTTSFPPCGFTPLQPNCNLQTDAIISKKIKVPLGVERLRFDINFGCLSFTCIGPPVSNDPRLTDFVLAEVIPSSDQVGPIFGSFTSFFSPSTGGFFGWKPFSLDVSTFAGQEITLRLSVGNQRDNRGEFPVILLIDNLRFGTVFVDVKIVDGAMADLPDDAARFERVRQQVRDTNEILAQAGINVQIRNIQIIPDPGNLLETDMTAIAIDSVSGKPELPPEVAQLNTLNRSSVSTDVNVYYVGALKKGTNTTNTFGLAVGPDDYHMTDPATQRGLIIRNLFGADLTLSTTDRQDKFREVLAHELGHLLIHGVAAEDAGGLEHTADSGNVMSGNRCTPPPPVPDPLTPAAPCSARAILKSEQAAIINQNGSGLIVP